MRSTTLAATAILALLVAPGRAATIHVGPGDSIQAAVDAASPGDGIKIAPGVYHEAGRPCPSNPNHTCAVVVAKDGLRIVGRPYNRKKGLQPDKAVILENPGGQDQGLVVAKTGDPACLSDSTLRVRGSVVSGIVARGFEGEGIFLFCVDDWKVTASAGIDDGEYGIFPSHCGRGRITKSFASGANDTGVYIGQSHEVRVDHNLSTGNVSGYEIENCVNVRLDHNEATGNTGGILSFTLPFLDAKYNRYNRVDHNLSHDNNKPNTCLDPTDAVCAVPRGTGILVLAADDNLIEDNTVTGNDTFGIAVANYCIALNLTPTECAALDIEPSPDRAQVVDNTVTGNAGAPDPSVPSIFAVDLAWDGQGTGNCWTGNTAGTLFPPVLPACP